MTTSPWKSGYDPALQRVELREIRAAYLSGDLEGFTRMFESGEWYEGQVRHFLFIASLRGHAPIVRYLLDKGVPFGSSPQSVFNSRYGTKSTAVLEDFMDHGWKVNDAGPDNHVILPYAMPDETMVRWLLDRGADPNIGYQRGAMARFMSPHSVTGQIRSRHEEEARIAQLTVELMQSSSDSEKNEIQQNIMNRMSKANILRFQHEGTDPVKFFFRNKATGRVRQEREPAPPPQDAILDVEEGPPFFESSEALDTAASCGTISLVNLLIERGAKPGNCLGLHSAAATGRAERIAMLDHLLALGLDINGTDTNHGFYSRGTPLHHAVHSRQIKIVQFLLENGADPGKKDRFGKLPIEYASPEQFPQWDNAKTFMELFEKYCDKKL